MKHLKRIQPSLASLLVIVALSVTFFAKTSNSANPENRFKIPKKITCVEDLPEELRQETKKEVVKIQLFPEETVTGQKEGTNMERPMFNVVTGSFHFKENAYRLADKLKNSGYEQTYVGFYDEEGLYRVIVQQHEKEEKAEKYLHQFKNDNPGYELAWLYQGKKKVENTILALTQPN